MIAFANGEGGEIWLGIDDDGSVKGISRSYEEDIMNICRTACIPPLAVEYQHVTVGQRHRRSDHCSQRKRQALLFEAATNIISGWGPPSGWPPGKSCCGCFRPQAPFTTTSLKSIGQTPGTLDLSQVASYFSRYQFDFTAVSEPERIRLMANTDILGETG